MVIRDLTPSDLDVITGIDGMCFPPDVAFPRELFEDCLDDPACDCRGVERDGGIVAFFIVYFSGPRSAQIITIDVHPGHRRQGIATALMTELEKRLREKGIKRAVLQVAVDNQAAQALYRKWEYEVRAMLDDYYGPGRNAYLMDKTIRVPRAPAHTSS